MRYYYDIDEEGGRVINGGFIDYQDAELYRAKAIGAGEEVSVVYEESDDYIERVVPRVKMILATKEGDVEVYEDGTQKPV